MAVKGYFFLLALQHKYMLKQEGQAFVEFKANISNFFL
jgi:hypothetical protein